MKIFCILAAALALAMPTLSAAKTYRLQQSEVRDLAGGAGFKALNILVPVGWTSRGGIYWNRPCARYGYEIGWQSTAPDRSEGVALLPAVTWGIPRRGCPHRTFQRLADVLAAQVQGIFSAVAFHSYKARPDLIDANLPVLDLGTQRSSFINEAGVLHFTGTDTYGKRVRGQILGKMVHVRTQTIGYNGVPGQDKWGGIVEPSLLHVGWPDRFRHGLADVIRRSIFADPTWAKKMHAHHAKTDRIVLKGKRDLLRFQSRFLRANSGLFSSFGQRDPNGDWLHRERTEAIRGVETYLNRSGEEVQLDHTYPYPWDLGDKTYLITDDPSYDPNVGTTLQAVRMRQAP